MKDILVFLQAFSLQRLFRSYSNSRDTPCCDSYTPTYYVAVYMQYIAKAKAILPFFQVPFFGEIAPILTEKAPILCRPRALQLQRHQRRRCTAAAISRVFPASAQQRSHSNVPPKQSQLARAGVCAARVPYGGSLLSKELVSRLPPHLDSSARLEKLVKRRQYGIPQAAAFRQTACTACLVLPAWFLTTTQHQ